MEPEVPNSYDELPYGDNCFAYTHPDHMATVARLHGLSPTPPAGCRVLELGCGMGGNLIPMALKFPDARFVGVDLSPRQVDHGKATVETLGLRNVDLRAASITDVDAGWGDFDYIVCHGVYSWVPAEVRDRILAIFAERLAPRGLAYVSYNSLPGWHARGLARDLMAFHVRRTGTIHDAAHSARAFLRGLVEALPDPTTAYGTILRAESQFLEGVDDAYLFHEHLEETNQPFYFHQFLADARAKGLDFVAEAQQDGLGRHLPEAARRRIEEWAGDPIDREQYVDFVVNRTFRRSFLRRTADEPGPRPSPQAVAEMAVSTTVAPSSRDVDVASDAPVAFSAPGNGPSITTNHPLLKAALGELAVARPRMLRFDELMDRIRVRLGTRFAESTTAPDVARPQLCDALYRGFLVDLVLLNIAPPRVAVEPGERPVAGPLARLLAPRGGRVTNIPGLSVDLDEAERLLLPLLDGSHTRDQLRAVVADRIDSGDFTISFDGRPLDDANRDQVITEMVEAGLRRFAATALLMP